MTDELSPFFESRETRVGRLPETARLSFETAEKQATAAGDPSFGDKQFVSLWLSRRTGLPRKDVTANFDEIAKRFFGDGITPQQAYDKISKEYQPVPP